MLLIHNTCYTNSLKKLHLLYLVQSILWIELRSKLLQTFSVHVARSLRKGQPVIQLHFSLSRYVVLCLTQSLLLVSAVKQRKELSLTPCWKWLPILDATFSNYSRYSTYSSLITRIYSVLYIMCIPQLSPVLNVHVGFVWWILFLQYSATDNCLLTSEGLITCPLLAQFVYFTTKLVSGMLLVVTYLFILLIK